MISRNLPWWLMLVLSTTTLHCRGANILAIFSDTSKSHVIAYEPLTKALAARGHQVTVISSHPQKVALANYTDIAVPHKWFGSDEKLSAKLNRDGSTDTDTEAPVFGTGFQRCLHFLADPQVHALINSNHAHFDLIIMEIYLHECFLGFAHKFNASIVGIYGHAGSHRDYDLVGNPSPYSYVPNMLHLYTDRMTLDERIRNAHSILLDKLVWMDQLERYDNITREHFKGLGEVPTTTQLQKKWISFIFFNNDVSLNLPRPLLPNVMDIAGMHINPAKKLPEHLQKFLDSSTDGVVLFSMGSHVGDFLQSKTKLRAILDAFSKLKQKVLWKRSDDIPGLPKNIRLEEWMPQADVLAHPNVLVFLTHGGLLGIQEAVYHSKPVVGIPIYGDQFFNVQRAQQLGFGIYLDYGNVTSESLQWALNTVIYQKSYTKNAQLACARFRDQPTSPLEKAVFWTEYVIRHNGARHLRSAALDLKWYQYLLLDVIGVLAFGVLVMAFLIVKFFKMAFRLLFGGRIVVDECVTSDENKEKQE